MPEPGCSSSQSVREDIERDFKTADEAQESISRNSSTDEEEDEERSLQFKGQSDTLDTEPHDLLSVDPDNSCHKKSKTQSKRKRDTRKVYMGNEEDSEDDNDWRSLETRPTKKLAESTSQLRLEEDELQSRGMGEELDLELEVEQAMPTFGDM
ncbi:hypothetical protein KOW79_009182 [Hemibagrus wyckioides]|uniref:Uncharacterized protein n=1 Tax=Hemibagrus wyckioides TaxID=337641 RepID=A0A9D3SK73_9TELE|nr:hypothetical protein KOW79_009182 [Hemibagrus wyckioides]